MTAAFGSKPCDGSGGWADFSMIGRGGVFYGFALLVAESYFYLDSPGRGKKNLQNEYALDSAQT